MTFSRSWVARCALVAGLALGCAAPLRAQGTATPAPATATPPAAPADGWQFNAAAFLWLPSVDGKVALNGHSVSDSTSVWDILSHADFPPVTLMGHVEAQQSSYGVFLEPIYMGLAFNPSGARGHADIQTHLFFLEFGGFLRLLQGQLDGGKGWFIDGLAGGRYTSLSNSTDLTLMFPEGSRNHSSAGNLEWVDPFIGFRARVELGGGWETQVRADIGGFGAGSRLSWQASGLVGYQFPLWGMPATAFGGYRALYQNYTQYSGRGSFQWDNTLRGPVLGLNLRF